MSGRSSEYDIVETDRDVVDRDSPTLVSGSKMLSQLGLNRNPYVDRTAEKTMLQTKSFYLHSDLQGFKPSETTYIFFGRRGSGKTTIRLMMMQKYEEYNADPKNELNRVFVVDLSRPGYIQSCLKAYMANIGAGYDNWDARFSDRWTSADVADCFLSTAVNTLVQHVSHNTTEGQRILFNLNKDKRAAAQFLLLVHLFTQEDAKSLEDLRKKLLPFSFYGLLAPTMRSGGISLLSAFATGLISFANALQSTMKGPSQVQTNVNAVPRSTSSFTPPGQNFSQKTSNDSSDADGISGNISGPWSWMKGKVYGESKTPVLPQATPIPVQVVAESPKTYSKIIGNFFFGLGQLTLFGAAVGLAGYGLMQLRRERMKENFRVRELVSPMRVVKLDDSQLKLLRNLLRQIASRQDSAETIRRLYIGDSAQQKLELLNTLCTGCGYAGGVAVFGDCFDEVGLLDPLLYPASLKAFAREVCRNEILNQGRLHFFFPDSRTALDLSTDRVVREARFDRHFVRDLQWSRFQLLDLAERRFAAAQEEGAISKGRNFASLFERVSKENFSAAISKLQTPRELMVFMTELLARLEAHSEDDKMIAAQDMEIAVSKAQAQSV